VHNKLIDIFLLRAWNLFNGFHFFFLFFIYLEKLYDELEIMFNGSSHSYPSNLLKKIKSVATVGCIRQLQISPLLRASFFRIVYNL
jgi:hypothetical protein